MNRHILDEAVQEFIKFNRQLAPTAIAFKKSPFAEVSSSELASQIDSWQRAVKKLPTWAYSPNIYYPDKINMEQCSSEHTALVKQTLITKGSKVVDVTGGFSVDSCYMAQEAQVVIHCELNEKLSHIVKHNAEQLGVRNLVPLHTDGVKFVEYQEDNSIDYIYIDPSRRVNHAKVFLLEDCEPNIVELQDMFFRKSRYVLCKLSPLMDINSALQKLKYVKLLYVVSLDGDCKELLFVQDKNFVGETKISAIRLFLEKFQSISFTLEEEKTAVIQTSGPLKYLYDPDVAITKAGAFKSIAKQFGLLKLHTHTHLYTSQEYVKDFPGRVFSVDKIFSLGEFKKLNNFPKANVATKNFPAKVDDIRKKYKIKDGGSDFLYFATDCSDNHIVIHCSKIT